MRYLSVIFVIFSILLTAYSVNAQSFDIPTTIPTQVNTENSDLPFGIEEQISITQIPKVPTPDENVKFFIESFSTDLNKANISWSVNGQVIESGFGKVNFNIKAPSAGERTTVVIRIRKSDGGTIVREAVLSPNDVDIIWEANTYTPFLYKGKALHTNQSEIRFVAMTNFVRSNGTTIDPSELVYKWKKNGSVLQDQSGYGKQTLTIIGDLIARPMEIEVTVTTNESEAIAKNRIFVDAEQPEVILYENNPVLGLMIERELEGTLMLERDEVEISALPFYYSIGGINTVDIEHKWLINGQNTGIPKYQYNVAFRKTPENKEGIVNISVETSHINKLLQEANRDFSIKLDSEESNNLRESAF